MVSWSHNISETRGARFVPARGTPARVAHCTTVTHRFSIHKHQPCGWHQLPNPRTMDAVERSPRDNSTPTSKDVYALLEGVAKLDHHDLLVFLQELRSLLPTDNITYLQELNAGGSQPKEQYNGMSDSRPRPNTS